MVSEIKKPARDAYEMFFIGLAGLGGQERHEMTHP